MFAFTAEQAFRQYTVLQAKTNATMFRSGANSGRWLQIGGSNIYRSVSTNKFWEESRKHVQRGTNVTSEIVEKGNKAAINAVQNGAKRVSNAVQVEANKAVQRGLAAARSSSRSVSDEIHSGTKAASANVRAAPRWAVSQAKESSNKVLSKASERIQNGSLGMFGNVQEFGQSTLRWFWWWSLAVVAVYGIATTLPKELIRYAVVNDSKAGNESEGMRPRTAPDSEHPSRVSWLQWVGLAPVSTKSQLSENEGYQPFFRWTLLRSHGGAKDNDNGR